MNLNGIFSSAEEFMNWLANNCYSCEKLGDVTTQYNHQCELEPIISYSDMTKEIEEKLTNMIIENGKLCKCKNFKIIGAKQLNLLNTVKERIVL